jgi:hypothetical protein
MMLLYYCQFGYGISSIVGLKKQDFWPKMLLRTHHEKIT